MLGIDILLAVVDIEAGVLQTVKQGDGVSAVDITGTGTAGDEVIRGAAEDGDILDVLERQGVGLVLKQDHAFEGGLAGHGGVSGEIRLVTVGIALHLRAAEDELEGALDAEVEVGLGEAAVLDGVDDLLVLQVGTRLEHVVAGTHLGRGVVTAVPVGHHGALVAPFVAQDGGYQVLALGGIGAVDLVVGGHDRPGIGFLDRDFEALEVDFALGAGADDGVVAGTVGLLVVVSEVLDGGTDIVLLDTADIGGGRLAGHERILGIIFEVTAVQRMTVNVQRRGEEHVGAVLVDFFTDGLADILDEFLVPSGSEEGSDREVGAVVGRIVAFAGRVDTQAGRTVSEDDGRDAEALEGAGGAGGAGHDGLGGADDGALAIIAGHAGADDERSLLFKGHGSDNLVDGSLAKLGVPVAARENEGGQTENNGEFLHILIGF